MVFLKIRMASHVTLQIDLAKGMSDSFNAVCRYAGDEKVPACRQSTAWD